MLLVGSRKRQNHLTETYENENIDQIWTNTSEVPVTFHNLHFLNSKIYT